MTTKKKAACNFLEKVLRRAQHEMAYECTDDSSFIRRTSATLRMKVIAAMSDDYVWLELCDIMSWKRRRVLNPPADKE